jgi:hypothetical protein
MSTSRRNCRFDEGESSSRVGGKGALVLPTHERQSIVFGRVWRRGGKGKERARVASTRLVQGVGELLRL